jgi:hypothetical protein
VQDLGQLDASGSGAVTVAGRLTIAIRTERLQTWLVSQVSVEMPGVNSGATCALRKNGNLVCPLRPRQDAGGGDPPITIRPADVLTVEWIGATPGLQGNATWFYTMVNP